MTQVGQVFAVPSVPQWLVGPAGRKLGKHSESFLHLLGGCLGQLCLLVGYCSNRRRSITILLLTDILECEIELLTEVRELV